MTFSTSSHIGDCLWAMQFLRRLGGQHAFYCPPEYLGQLRELMADTEIVLEDVNARPPGTEDVWIANARFEHQGVFYHQGYNDIIGFIIDYFNHMGGVAGMPHPLFANREHFLFDLPRSNARIPHFDILMVNAQPTSGQVPEFCNAQLNELIGRLAQHYSVVCTNPTTAKNALVLDASILRIGHYSQHCGLIIGVATGPLWLTFNTQNRGTPRHVLLAPQHLDYGPTVPIQSHGNVTGLTQALEATGWL